MAIKLTPAQQLVFNGVLALVVSALSGAASAFVQNYNSGKVDLQSCLLIALGLFCTTFGASLYAYVPAHIVQLLQAKDDWIAQLQSSHMQLLTSHQTLQEAHSGVVTALNKALARPNVQSAVQPSQSENEVHPTEVEVVDVGVKGDTVPRMQAMVASSAPIAPVAQS